MSLNASLHIPNTSKNDQATIVDIDAIMDNVSIVLYTLTVVLGITGNSMVIWVAGFKLKYNTKHSHAILLFSFLFIPFPCFLVPPLFFSSFLLPPQPKVTNVWLVNLAIADLIFCFTRVFSLTKKLFFDHWPFGIFLCKFNGFFKYANMFCSVFLLAVISLDRVLCVWQPVFTRRRRTLWAARVVAFCVWTTAIVFSTPYFIHRQVYLKNNLSKCSVDPKEKGGNSSTKLALYSIRFLCGFMLPFMVILICYILAGLGIRRTRLSGKSRPLRILAALVVAFFLCWAPYHCLLLVKMVNSKNPVVKIWHPVASGIAYFNSCVNPLLYFCMGLDMRGRFRQSLAGVYKRALADDEDGQTTQSNDRSMDDSTGSKHTTVVVAGRSQTSVEVAKV
ncbi:C3a anaphylatoxin chemotactic receptor-like isoform X2 [Siniperca chuatsi]|uniref:C3a anaphylatoxin chemotactic receptor-like isoform X2 n=1 Tax=Siniperca chuatsi TaxID=119488 RepID=UPI001CE1551F|nr:C3a anaphylatoxin chemotactic receptor-like isoform X2 [Siniperca chuatsi]XP_044028129.1 C3a anaphylatoxin chemotactic receptor-like isoform X2 [Siniperca chuatsi]XP_044028130.1 C3a anaphylatoxin chemotactic receptor-like isoform X2 [Siniperca chuatsi]